ncbi:Aste57867_17237 [Aphanomyces stellatus]|uniref:Aste57867_17237 protein n=1 Tax=Aphanomyces stellatus TaxID=120398 RepID=A0A485L7A9_9STRA|nr:hypothetical protein As57867_017178 [Aphanomyces stellatus]VFT93993.1 Aste57867_17237 [Aphanomyces stellatus]
MPMLALASSTPTEPKRGFFARFFQKKTRCTCDELELTRRATFMKQLNTHRQPDRVVSLQRANKLTRGSKLPHLRVSSPTTIDEDPSVFLCPHCLAQAGRTTDIEEEE